MALKEKWKSTGKNTGKAFAYFGKALGKTMKTVFTDDENMIESNGHTEVSNAWRETGKAFGEAGKSFGSAVDGPADKAFGKEEKEKAKPNKDEPKEENKDDNDVPLLDYSNEEKRD